MSRSLSENPYFQGIEIENRMTVIDQIRENLRNRVMEPVGGLLGNIIRDNVYALGRTLKDTVSPLGQSFMHVRNSLWKTLGVPFAPIQQFFGAGVGELIALRPWDAGARTAAGFGASAVLARQAVGEAAESVLNLGNSVRGFFGGVRSIYDNVVFGATRLATGLLFGKKADSLLYQVQPIPPLFQTAWNVAAEDNEHTPNRDLQWEVRQRNFAHRNDFQTAIYNQFDADSSVNQLSVPSKTVVLPEMRQAA